MDLFQVDALPVRIFPSAGAMSDYAATSVYEYLAATLQRKGSAAVILATGNSQIQFLDRLVARGALDWSKITLFHMDEYLGISATHRASFRHYMKTRVETRVKPGAFHYLEG